MNPNEVVSITLNYEEAYHLMGLLTAARDLADGNIEAAKHAIGWAYTSVSPEAVLSCADKLVKFGEWGQRISRQRSAKQEPSS